MQSSNMQISFDDMISQNDSEIGDSKPATARSQRINKARMTEGIGTFNGLFYKFLSLLKYEFLQHINVV